MAIKTNIAALLCGMIVICSGQSVVAQSNQLHISQEHKKLMNTVLKKSSPYANEAAGESQAVRTQAVRTQAVRTQAVRTQPVRTQPVQAQTVRNRTPRRLPAPLQVRPLSYAQPRYQGHPQVIQGDPTNPNAPSTHGYPYLNAPLYPTTQPNILHQTGSTVITNQALNPHEMLYPHKYHAMYGPYYYKVNGHWATLPWGIWSAENWRLQGTHVHINYRSKRRFLSGFHPPSIR